MGSSIYDDMSGLRPKRRQRRDRRRSHTDARAPGSEPAEPPAPVRPPDDQAEEYAPRVIGPMARPEWSGDSRLQASIDHLRSRSRIQAPSDHHGESPARANRVAPDRPPITDFVEAAHPEPPVNQPAPSSDRRVEAEPDAGRVAKQQVKRWNKALRKAERAQHREARAEARQLRRRAPDPGVGAGLQAPPPPPPPSRAERASMSRSERREAAKTARAEARNNYERAKEAIATTRRVGSAQIAEARGRARNTEHLASVIPKGEWNRRELRRHITTARRRAKAEAAELAASHSVVVAKMRAQAREYRRQSRRWHRPLAQNAISALGDSRLLTMRAGIVGGWVCLAGSAWLAWQDGKLADSGLVWLLAALTGALLVFSTVPWRRIAERPLFTILAALWIALLIVSMVTSADYHESSIVLFVGATWIILFAAVLLPQLGFGLTAAAAIAAYDISIRLGPVDLPTRELVIRVLALTATAIIIGLTAHELRRQAVVTLTELRRLDAQKRRLADREAELLQLYEVSRTLGAGDLREVLPELVARTAGYIGAKVGLVILHRTDTNTLVALSPLWVAGQALEAEGYRFDPEGDSTAASVYGSGAPYMRNALSEDDIARDNLLADLGVERVAAVPLRVEGQTIGVLLVADKTSDFTERDLAALELLATPAGLVLNHLARYEDAQETGRRMSEVAQLKSDFVSTVSHELRTPLTSVIGALSTLARPELAPENPVAQSLIESASGQAYRLKTLIEDLLTVSKIDNRALPVRFDIVDLGEEINKLVNRVPDWTSHVDVEISPRLPRVAVDPAHFERVMTNLLDNARKYAPESRVEVTARAVDREVWVSVVDHGEGIPYEYENAVFERFTQIERADTRLKGGTGLGLNIVRDLTEAMRGRIWLETTPGSGATFTLAFPRAEHGDTARLEVGEGMLLVDPSRDRVEAPINMDDLAGRGGGPIAE